MTNREYYREMLKGMFENALAEYTSCGERDYIDILKEWTDERLDTNLSPIQIDVVNDILEELEMVSRHRAKHAYLKGMEDGAWLKQQEAKLLLL